MQKLLLYIRDRQGDVVDWLSCQEDGSYSSGSTSIDRISELGIDRDIELYFPSQYCNTFIHAIPSKKPGEIRAAALALIEEQLLGETEDVELTIQPLAEQQFCIGVIKKVLIHHWLSRLQNQNVQPSTVSPDFMLLPCPTEEATVYITEEHTIVRTGQFTGETILTPAGNTHYLTDWLICNQNISHKGIRCFAPDKYFTKIEPSSSIPLKHQDIPDEHHPLQFSLDQENTVSGLNFMQGEMSQRYRITSYPQWHWPLHAAAIGALVIGITLFFSNHLLQNDIEIVDQNIDQQFRTTFPHIHTIVDYQKQYARELGKKHTGSPLSDAIDSLHEILTIIHHHPQIRLTTLSLHNQMYTLDIHSPTITSAQQMIDDMNNSTVLLAKLLQSSKHKNQMLIRIQVKRG